MTFSGLRRDTYCQKRYTKWLEVLQNNNERQTRMEMTVTN